MSQLTIGGVVPDVLKAPLRPGEITFDESTLLGEIHEALARLFYDGQSLTKMEDELATLDARCVKRRGQLDDPSLRAHPGYAKARDEYSAWLNDAIGLASEVKVLRQELIDLAKTINGTYALLPAAVQRELVGSQHWCHPRTADLIRTWPEIAKLPAWRALLPGWGSRYSEPTF